MTPELSRHEQLRQALERALSAPARKAQPADGSPVDVVVTPNEMNDKHGTGVLVKRVFEGHSRIFSIRARNDYGEDHTFGDASCVLSHGGSSRADSYRNVLRALGGRSVRHVACIPLVSDDLLTSIALRDVFGAPLCMWIMDDQNLAAEVIPDALMREALEKSALRLATHPEMRDAYEGKYGLRFWLLPAVVPGSLIRDSAEVPRGSKAESRTGALVGSIWSPRWLELLCRTLGASGLATDWYGNDTPHTWVIPRQTLAGAGIRPHGILPEPALAVALRDHPYAVVPTGTLDGNDGTLEPIARLSLPGRILFVAASSGTPVIVLGNERTPASRFVKRFGIGLTSSYDGGAYRRAVEEITTPQVQSTMRRNAGAFARVLAAEDVGAWLWRSVERGEPADRRFENMWASVPEPGLDGPTRGAS